MHAVVIYESMYGNTRAIAEAIGDGLRSAFDTTVVPVHDATAEVLVAADLVAVGGPTHAHGMSRVSTRKAAVDAANHKPLKLDASAAGLGLREWFDTADRRPQGIGVAFDTRLRMRSSVTGRAGRGIARRLRRCGFADVRDAGSFFVDKNNELLPGEAERAAAWARALVQGLQGAGATPPG